MEFGKCLEFRQNADQLSQRLIWFFASAWREQRGGEGWLVHSSCQPWELLKCCAETWNIKCVGRYFLKWFWHGSQLCSNSPWLMARRYVDSDGWSRDYCLQAKDRALSVLISWLPWTSLLDNLASALIWPNLSDFLPNTSQLVPPLLQNQLSPQVILFFKDLRCKATNSKEKSKACWEYGLLS